MKFHIALLSFVPSVQKTLLKPEFKGTRIELAENLLKDNAKYIPRRGKRGYISLYFGDFLFGDDGRLLSARLGKSKDVILPKYDDSKQEYYTKEDKTYPHVYFLWDRDEQTILIERDTSVFWNYEVVLKSIEDHLNNLMNAYEIRVFIEPLTEKMDFWKAIKSYKYLYEVNFELHMPNSLGKTLSAIKEALDMYKKDYNATGVSNQISNEDGRLKIPEDDQQVNANLEWITKGGGKWTTKGKKADGKRKAKITSTKSQYIRTEETTVELENYDIEEILVILAELRRKYSVFNKQSDNDEDR
jgi:hypothetical protein